MDYAAVLRRRWLLVTSCAVLLALVGFGWSMQQTKKYQGKAEVLVDFSSSPQSLSTNGASGPVLNSTDRGRALQNELRFAKSAVVQSPLEQKVGHKPNVSASGETSTADVLTFSATSTSPAQAATDANAYAETYVAARAQRFVQSYGDNAKAVDDVLTDLHSKLNALGPAPVSGTDPNATQRSALDGQIKLYEGIRTAQDVAAKVGQGAGATIITRAETPTSPVSPKPVRSTALALAVGLVLGIGLAFLREFLDDTIRSTDDLERTVDGVTVLGAIPKDKVQAAARPAASHDSGGRLEEAFRSLRTSVQFVGLHRSLLAIQVTSANASEGKTTVASHLAAALVYGGEHVVLIDGDLRNPSLHTRFGLPNEVGLSTVMLGQAELRQALQPVEGLPGLMVLAAGPLPGNPADFLWPGSAPLAAGATLFDVIGACVRAGYRVVVDSPPVLPVADAMTISRVVQGTIVVVAAGSTGSRGLGQALQQLAQAEAKLVGIAFNTVSDSAGYGAGYGYGYGYGARPTGPLARFRARLRRGGPRGAVVRPVSGDTGWQGRPVGVEPVPHSGVGAGPAPVPDVPRRSTPLSVPPARSMAGPGSADPVANGGDAGAEPRVNQSDGSPGRIPPPQSIDLRGTRTVGNGVHSTGGSVSPPSARLAAAQPAEPGSGVRQNHTYQDSEIELPPVPSAENQRVNAVNGADSAAAHRNGTVAANGAVSISGAVSANGVGPGNGAAANGHELEEALRRHLGVEPTADGGVQSPGLQ